MAEGYGESVVATTSQQNAGVDDQEEKRDGVCTVNFLIIYATPRNSYLLPPEKQHI